MVDETVIMLPSGQVLEDDEASDPPISLPDSGDTGEGGKLNMIVQLVKKCLGVKDIAAMYVSHSSPFICTAHYSIKKALITSCFPPRASS